MTTALAWQGAYGVAPAITSALSEYDAAKLVKLTDEEYSAAMKGRSAVAKGADFVWQGVRYQVKANRPSGLPRSNVTWAPKATNYEWDVLIWILYDREYRITEAWRWDREPYRTEFHLVKRLSPKHYQRGHKLA